MPKIVDKQKRREEIALTCADLIHDLGIKNITVAQVAKTAGIGKGTVYEYFENKDDIIFEIINIHIKNYNEEFDELIDNVTTIREKLEIFFRLVLIDSEENQKHLNGYRDFLSIVLADDNPKMKEFNCNKNEVFTEKLYGIFQEGVNRGELKSEALDLVDGLITYQMGLALRKMAQNDFDAKECFEKFIGTIFKLIEVKKID